MKRHIQKYLNKQNIVLALALSIAIPQTVFAESENKPLAEEFRLFCGYHDAKVDPKIAKLSEKKQYRKIAKLAKTSPKKLKTAIEAMSKYGSNCENVGAYFENTLKSSIPKSLSSRIDIMRFDRSDPSHVLVSLRFKGIDRRKVVEEASLLSQAIASSTPIVKTIAVRIINPRVKDPESFEALWFEALIGGVRATKIAPEKVKDYANRRYIRLFDSVQCGHDLLNEHALGYRGGPCVGKEAKAPEKTEENITKVSKN